MNLCKDLSILVLLLIVSLSLPAQNSVKSNDSPLKLPKSYVIQHTQQALKIDGGLNEVDWQKVQWTSDFVDIEGAKKPSPALKTKVKMLWNDSTLFIAARLEEPQVWATLMNHDDIIYYDNDFEIFIDPHGNGHNYFEIEINAFNKIFDLFIPKPYRNGGDALISWNVANLKSAIKVDGTINNPADVDKGWTIEMAIPLKSLYLGHPFKAPKEGSLWRINFSRVQWDTKISHGKNMKLKDASGKDLPEHNWVWSPQGLINMHYPEHWGYLQFSKNENTVFNLPYVERQKQHLWLIYKNQKKHHGKFGKYATNLKELGMNGQQNIEGKENLLQMQATDHQFTATIAVKGGKVIHLNEEGLLYFKK
ncbi:hypothetical protein AAKU52_001628 [Pedobacter sp. CG_S7]|uniref:carbohydrate-binding family 9-like protein n=1 Tax=Pedobacter sp. CG_S7 TaxID=3143930 RepID=UPI0033915EEE